MPRKKFDSGRIRILILNVHAACPEPDIPPYFRFSKEYGLVRATIGTMAQAISHSAITDREICHSPKIATAHLFLYLVDEGITFSTHSRCS